MFAVIHHWRRWQGDSPRSLPPAAGAGAAAGSSGSEMVESWVVTTGGSIGAGAGGSVASGAGAGGSVGSGGAGSEMSTAATAAAASAPASLLIALADAQIACRPLPVVHAGQVKLYDFKPRH